MEETFSNIVLHSLHILLLVLTMLIYREIIEMFKMVLNTNVVTLLAIIVDSAVPHSLVTSSAAAWSVNGPTPSQAAFTNLQPGGFLDSAMSSAGNPFTGT
jgi:hypothetical protein